MGNRIPLVSQLLCQYSYTDKVIQGRLGRCHARLVYEAAGEELPEQDEAAGTTERIIQVMRYFALLLYTMVDMEYKTVDSHASVRSYMNPVPA